MLFKDSYTIAELEEHRKEWIVALRSGNYKQGKAKLRTADDYYCCLGVACDVAGDPGEKIEQQSYYSYFDPNTKYRVASSLPSHILNYYGFSGPTGQYNRKEYAEGSFGYMSSLSNKNDFDGMDFNEIADIIENNWDSVFTNKFASDYKESPESGSF